MKYTTCSVLVALCLHCSTGAQAQSLSLDSCKSIREKIEKYDVLRRKGGSAAQMDSWRKSRAALEERFRLGKCHKYGRSVR
jgi:hypothetical protein